MMELSERAPNRLMDAQRVRVLHERGKQEVERVARPAAGGEVARQRETRAPVVRRFVDEPLAQTRETLGLSGADRQRLETIEGEVGTVPRDVDQLLPDRGGRPFVALQHAHVAEVQVRGYGPRIEIDGA